MFSTGQNLSRRPNFNDVSRNLRLNSEINGSDPRSAINFHLKNLFKQKVAQTQISVCFAHFIFILSGFFAREVMTNNLVNFRGLWLRFRLKPRLLKMFEYGLEF